MIKFDYLSKGLNALARAHHLSSMAGHLGASVVAGYFVWEQRPDLEPEVYRGIEGDLERVMRGESVFGKKMTKHSKMADPELFADFPSEKPNENLIDEIASALQKNIGQLRQSGHNVIFASIAIRALKEHPELATPSIVGGICKLLSLFDHAHPGSGNYGKAKGRITGDKISLPEADTTPPYNEIEGMGKAVLDELIRQDPDEHRQGYGGLVHINNHAAAIVCLEQYGYGALVADAVESHRQHLRLWRNLPDLGAELGAVRISKFSPYAAAYWMQGEVPYDRALLTHRVKTMYGFDELVGGIDDGVRGDKAFEKLGFLM